MRKTKADRMFGSIVERINYRDILLIVLGTFLMAVAINFIFDPIGLDVGGVSGLAIVLRYASLRVFEGTDIKFLENGIPVWLMSTALNVPLFIIAIIKKGWRYMAKTTASTVLFTLFLGVLPMRPFLDDKLLSALVGGALSGIGIGLVFSTFATTGGTDLFSALLHERFRHLSIPTILMVTDGIIVILGITVFDIDNVIYSVIVVFLVSKISDAILEGLKFAKMTFIISEEAEIISAEILETMDRGVTGIQVKGMYSGKDKKMLFCVVSKKQLPLLQDIVKRHDKRAFMVIADAREVNGEGFAEIKEG